MGRTLIIRVQATTLCEDEVRRRWPRLWTLAFEVHPPAFPCTMRGVLEMVAALHDIRQFRGADLPDDVVAVLSLGMPQVLAARAALEHALARWDVQAASTATDALEDALDDLERQMPRMP